MMHARYLSSLSALLLLSGFGIAQSQTLVQKQTMALEAPKLLMFAEI